ncbi:hypothetical protein [Providencia sneebia]|uniref:Major outer membrane protein n=1 Tax=Providencia sneebia DSM 19967 TaxID=1141660 RepID=K8WXP6_9GAMM|nr:hypothetical protein [Providencia sneebia]EKT60980.1 major outer membrane protein [Providencia sneebia DSM 19967]
MKNNRLILSLFLLILPFTVKAEDDEKLFIPNGYIGLTQTFYGNAGSYKTATSHPSFIANYNFSPEWSLALQWDRTWNMYHYDGKEKQQDNRFSGPKGTLSYNGGFINSSKVKWSSSIMVENENEFSGSNQTYSLIQTSFDFSEYIPSNGYIKATQFAFSPMYIYGVNSGGDSGHVNTGIFSLLTNWELPANFSITFNAYAFREWYNGSMMINNGTQSYENANYFMIMAWLNYTNELIKFNESTSLSFNFTGGLDPYIASNKKAAWDPFIAGNQMYEWLSPTIMEGNYKSTYTLFALPQLTLNYQLNQDVSFSIFAQAKYSNQVWGSTEKDWRIQPQGGVGFKYTF